MPQDALYVLSQADLRAKPKCDALMKELANEASMSEATLITRLQNTANATRQYVYDGPSSKVALTPAELLDSADPPNVTTVGQWFAAFSGRQGLSQINGLATFFRFSDWQSWISQFQEHNFFILSNGNVNYYAVGTVMHEILHKQFVGGFTHSDMDNAITAVGWPTINSDRVSRESAVFGLFCFGDRQ